MGVDVEFVGDIDDVFVCDDDFLGDVYFEFGVFDVGLYCVFCVEVWFEYV